MTQPPPPPRDERFLSRWSRLKRAQAQATTAVAGAPGSAAAPAAASGAQPVPAVAETATPDLLALPSIESLTLDSDYAQFFQPKVPEALRRAAVKKLFADPHFNTMDGLDTYIDDYTRFEPIPEAIMKGLIHARDIIDHPSNAKIGDEAGIAADQGSAAPAQLQPKSAESVAELVPQPDSFGDAEAAPPIPDEPSARGSSGTSLCPTVPSMDAAVGHKIVPDLHLPSAGARSGSE